MTPYDRMMPFFADAWRAQLRMSELLSLGGIPPRRPRAARLDQLRHPRIITVKSPGGFIMEVDPKTRASTGEPQQFEWTEEATNALRPLPRGQWIERPAVVDVAAVRLG